MPQDQETLAQLVERVMPTKFETLRDADRATDVPYGTWQNILLRGTIPTLETLQKVATALDLEEWTVFNAASASRAARVQAKSAPSEEEAKPLVSRRRSKRGKRPNTGSTDPRPHSE